MSRIKIQKQLERCAAPRTMLISNSSGEIVFQLHQEAITDDLAIETFDELSGATPITPADDTVLIRSEGEAKTVKITIQRLLELAAGGGALTFENGVFESAGVVQVGGAQTADIIISGSGNNFVLTGQTDLGFVAVNAIAFQTTGGTGDIDLQSAADFVARAAGDAYLDPDGVAYVGSAGNPVEISRRYRLPVSAPDSTPGAKQQIVATGNGAGASLGWENLGSGGAGGGLTDFSLTVGGVTINGKYSGGSVPTLTNPSTGVYLLTEPSGTRLVSFTLTGNDTNLDGTQQLTLQVNGDTKLRYVSQQMWELTNNKPVDFFGGFGIDPVQVAATATRVDNTWQNMNGFGANGYRIQMTVIS